MRAFVHVLESVGNNPEGDVRGEILATVQMRGLADMVERDREETREKLVDAFDCVIDNALCVRFDDECVHCGELLLRYVEDDLTVKVSSLCGNPKCENGFPPNYVLHSLTVRFPPVPNECASAYLERLTAQWRKETLATISIDDRRGR